MKSGELALLPAVRKADQDMIVIADGFSCKTQIQQSDAGRGALHVAQVMKMVREHGAQGYSSGPPEEPYFENLPKPPAAADRSGRRPGRRVGRRCHAAPARETRLKSAGARETVVALGAPELLTR